MLIDDNYSVLNSNITPQASPYLDWPCGNVLSVPHSLLWDALHAYLKNKMKKSQWIQTEFKIWHYQRMLHCPDYKVTKTQNRRYWLMWAKPKSKCDFINYFWVAITQLALLLVKTDAYQGKFHFNPTAGMSLNHHGNFKDQRFQLFE